MSSDLPRALRFAGVVALCIVAVVWRTDARQAPAVPQARVAQQAPSTQQAPVATGATANALVIAGDVAQTLSILPAELKTMPRTTVTVDDNGRQVRYEGVLVGELLKRAGVPLGRDLSGKAVASYVRASAGDGYQVVFALPELDPAFTASDIIVADTIDGQPLFDYQGPLRLVAPHDKRGARSIRMVHRLEVVRLVK